MAPTNIYYTIKITKIKNKNKKIKRFYRKVIWLNPPFLKNVKTNIGKKFVNLIKHHFPKHRKMIKISNKNTIKLSYSCCRNIGSAIASHNRIFIQPTSNIHGCYCRKRSDCLFHNKCLTTNVVYKVVVLAPCNPHSKHDGIADTTFKDCSRNHTRDFN